MERRFERVFDFYRTSLYNLYTLHVYTLYVPTLYTRCVVQRRVNAARAQASVSWLGPKVGGHAGLEAVCALCEGRG